MSLYPDDNFGDQRAMWSKPATLALKAEVYLWSGKKMNGGSSDIETCLLYTSETGFGNVGLKDGKPFIEVKYGKIDVKKCFVSDIETDFVN